jgi:hypothetical protein
MLWDKVNSLLAVDAFHCRIAGARCGRHRPFGFLR